MIRLLIADDHVRFRRALRGLLERQPDLEVVADVADAAAAVAAVLAAGDTGPDLVVLDMRMPGLGSIEATRQLLAARPTLAVLGLSSYDDPALVGALAAAGGRGYVLKGDPLPLLLQAVHELAAGGRCFSPSLGIPEAESPSAPDSPPPPSPSIVRPIPPARRKPEKRR
jgi:two-component system NarL family response regulator